MAWDRGREDYKSSIWGGQFSSTSTGGGKRERAGAQGSESRKRKRRNVDEDEKSRRKEEEEEEKKKKKRKDVRGKERNGRGERGANDSVRLGTYSSARRERHGRGEREKCGSADRRCARHTGTIRAIAEREREISRRGERTGRSDNWITNRRRQEQRRTVDGR